jgi:hypothetical protein
MQAKVGRPSIPPEPLLRMQLLPLLDSVRSERFLRKEIDTTFCFAGLWG